MWPEGASAPNGTVKCRAPEMVTPASRTTAVLLVRLNLTIRALKTTQNVSLFGLCQQILH